MGLALFPIRSRFDLVDDRLRNLERSFSSRFFVFPLAGCGACCVFDSDLREHVGLQHGGNHVLYDRLHSDVCRWIDCGERPWGCCNRSLRNPDRKNHLARHHRSVSPLAGYAFWRKPYESLAAVCDGKCFADLTPLY